MKGWDMKAISGAAGRGLAIKPADGQPLSVDKPKRNKFGNKPVTIDGILFQSTLEGNYYTQLKLRVRAGDIVSFDMQVPYVFTINGVKVSTYRADFVVTWPDGRITVEDTKGVETPDFKIKKNLMLALYGIEVKLVKAT